MSEPAKKPSEAPPGGSPAERAIQQKSPASTPASPEDLLKKHSQLGEDHPQYVLLKEAIRRNNAEQIKKIVAELEGQSRTQASPNPNPVAAARFPVWNVFWVIFLTLCLSAGVIAMEHARFAHGLPAPAAQSQPVLYLGSELLGGNPSQDFGNDIVLEMNRIKPDRVLFIGHQLAKLEIVEYLSAISKRAGIKILIGNDATGANQLANPQSPLRQYLSYADLRTARYPVRTQALIAVNTTTQTGMALVGTYPYDIADASQGEHTTVYIRDYKECVKLYNFYNKLFPAK
jgi:hypothetical protein